MFWKARPRIGNETARGRFQAVKVEKEKISKYSGAIAKKIFPEPCTGWKVGLEKLLAD